MKKKKLDNYYRQFARKQVKPIGFEAPRGGASNNRLCRTHNIQAYFGKFSIIVMFQKF